jgi:putative DNA primase/helicase
LFLNPVPHRWDPDADTSFVRAYLLGLACGDPGVAANLAEAAGLALYRGARFRTAVLLLGKGRNGKSTYLDAVRAAVGEANCSAVSIQTMGDPFGPADLHGKLLNVVDDLPVEFATGQALGAFKTAVSGGLMRCNPKNRDAFAFKPYAQWLVAANEIPRMGDTTEGVWDRLHVVKFNRRFEPWEHDPGLAGRLTGEAGCEALIRLGVEALRGVEDRGCMTETDAGKEARQAARAESDNVLQWLESDEFDRTTFVGELGAEGGRRSTTKTYAEYREWCESAGCVAVSMARFVPRLCGLLPLKTAQLDYPRGSRGNRVKCFVPIEGE